MESRMITLNMKRPKTREELRKEKQSRAIVGLTVSVLVLVIAACLLLFSLVFLVTAQAAQGEAEPKAGPMQEEAAAPPTVYIEERPELEAEQPDTPAIDPGELELLALVIYQEAGGDACSDETRRMVGEVVLNRVADPRFPDTLEEVLLQKGQYGRLYWTGLQWADRAALPEEAPAVERAYQVAEEVLTSEDRLLPEDVIFQCEFAQTDDIVAVSDGFYFCR